MFDKSFVEEIRKEKTIETANALIGQSMTSAPGFKPYVALPGSFEMHGLEHMMPGRARFRGNLTTKSVDHFCEYVEQHKGSDIPSVYVDDESMSAEAFFNLGTIADPGHGDDKACLTLVKTAAYKSILQINSKKMSQREMAEWLLDWEENLIALDDNGDEMSFANAVSRVRNIEINHQTKAESGVGNFEESQSSTSKTSVASNAGSLPSGFRFDTETWAGLPERTFILRLAALGDSGLNLKIVKLEAMQEVIVNDFKGRLEEDLSAEADVIVGSFDTGR